jgi:hypothetical protein
MEKKFVSFCFYMAIISLGLLVHSCSDDDSKLTPKEFSAAGNILGTMDEFRNLLGTNNGGDSGPFTTGRREINWDGIPDSIARPNGYIGDFFNQNISGQTRGIEFTTPGMGLIVSADKNNPTNTPTSFGEINPSYSTIFPPFSGERIFSPLGSNIADIRFYVPGTKKAAAVRGFGAVYIDVDSPENKAFEFFDINENSLGNYSTPILNEGHVFLGLLFDNPVIHHVRITYGNSPLGPNDGGGVDISVMDDFIFGEPQEIK